MRAGYLARDRQVLGGPQVKRFLASLDFYRADDPAEPRFQRLLSRLEAAEDTRRQRGRSDES